MVSTFHQFILLINFMISFLAAACMPLEEHRIFVQPLQMYNYNFC